MKARHLNMIAIGGSIGAGFFVGSGSALTKGGPASVLICFLISGVMIFNVVYALGELAVMYPVSGGFYTYSVRFVDPSWGFAMGWNYVSDFELSHSRHARLLRGVESNPLAIKQVFQWIIVLPLELTVCSFTVQYWNKDISVAVWITIFWVFIIIINIFGTLGYAEEEFWASLFKLLATVIFMVVAVILICGGGPSGGKYDEYWGARLWYDPGAFQNGFKGFCSVFVTAAFAFAGTELVGLAAAESSNPTKALPSAIKQVFWRITLFYILGLTFVGLLVSSTDDRLLNAGNPYADGVSPFVLAPLDAGLKGYDSFMNVVILVSVVSIGVSCVFGGSRTLTALAQQGYAPKIFAYIDRSGRPLPSVAINLAFGALAYVTLASSGGVVFDWLLALSGLAALFTWGSICVVCTLLVFHSCLRRIHANHLNRRPIFVSDKPGLPKAAPSTISPSRPSSVSRAPGSDSSFASLLSPRSSTLPLLLRSTTASSPTPKASSRRTSPSLSCSSSGPLDTCGSARVSSSWTRSIWTLAGGSTTGTPSTRTGPRLLLCPLGGVLCTRRSKKTKKKQNVVSRKPSNWLGRCFFGGCTLWCCTTFNTKRGQVLGGWKGWLVAYHDRC